MARQIVTLKGLKGNHIDFNGKKGYTNDKSASNGKVRVLFPNGIRVPSMCPLGKVMYADIPVDNLTFVTRKAIVTK
jgi:hypothetical protein